MSEKQQEKPATRRPEFFNMLSDRSRPRNRYLVINLPAPHTMACCAQLDDEGWEIVSVGGFIVGVPGGVEQHNVICARISRDLPETKTEKEIHESLSRKVQPVKGSLKL